MNWDTLQKSPSTAVLLLVFILLFVFHVLPRTASKGLFVGLAPAHCGQDVTDRLIVLRITKQNVIFINQEQEDWDTLTSRLSDIYKLRVNRTIYITADDDVAFQAVADAIDIVHNANVGGSVRRGSGAESARITVKLITPAAVNAPCPQTAHNPHP